MRRQWRCWRFCSCCRACLSLRWGTRSRRARRPLSHECHDEPFPHFADTRMSDYRGDEVVSTFEAARDFLLQNRENYERAYTDFRWPDPVPFNWAIDWFDKP